MKILDIEFNAIAESSNANGGSSPMRDLKNSKKSPIVQARLSLKSLQVGKAKENRGKRCGKENRTVPPICLALVCGSLKAHAHLSS